MLCSTFSICKIYFIVLWRIVGGKGGRNCYFWRNFNRKMWYIWHISDRNIVLKRIVLFKMNLTLLVYTWNWKSPLLLFFWITVIIVFKMSSFNFLMHTGKINHFFLLDSHRVHFKLTLLWIELKKFIKVLSILREVNIKLTWYMVVC